MSLVHLIELILVLAILIVIGLPLFSSARRGSIYSTPDELQEQYAHLLMRKEEVLLAIKELEFDMKTDKLSTGDYEETRAKLEKEALTILEQLDELEAEKKRGHKTPKADVA